MFLLARPVIYKENNKETRAMWWVFLSCQITEAATEGFYKRGVPKSFAKVTGKHLHQKSNC